MANFRKEYKSKTFGFGNIAVNRLQRAEKNKISRKKLRAALFNENRNILNNSSRKQEVEPAQEINRTTRLLKWKEEREKRKRLEQANKKPAFVVGKMHHKIYSPMGEISAPLKQTATKQSSTKEMTNVKQNPLPKGITKATEKRLQRKANEKKVDLKATTKKLNLTDKVKDTKENEQPSTSGVFTAQRIKINNDSIMFGNVKFDEEEDTSEETFTLKVSLDENEKDKDSNNSTYSIPENDEVEAHNSISEARNIDTSTSAHNKSTPDNQCEPAFFSPYIVSSRGKDNARKEQQLRRGFSLDPSPKDNVPTKDTVMKNLNISVEEEERTAQYFLFLLNQEIDRLNELCEKWMKVKDEDETTEDGQYEINQAIGQTNLLISKKFERFRRLVTDCESGRGEMLVTCRDLQGFWDSMYVEIRNCDSRFQKLEKLRSRGWKEAETPIVNKPVVKKKTNAKKKIAPNKPSSFRTFLQNKKNKMAEGMSNNDDTKKDDSNSNNIASNESEGMKPVIDNSKRRSLSIGARKMIPLGSKRRSSLLQEAQSDTSKSLKSPLTIMKISQMCKTPVVLLDDSISYINSKQTPAKSILKQSKNIVIDSRSKSSNKVNFDDQVVSNEVPVDEETRIKMNLSAALSRIDELDLDKPIIRAEKKLDFDDYDEDDNNIKQESVLNNHKFLTPVPTSKTEELNKSQTMERRRSLRRQNAIVMDVDDELLNEISSANVCNSTPFKYTLNNVDLNSVENEDKGLEFADNVRILRSRVITPISTPRARRSKRATINVLELEHKENETPSVINHLEEGVKVRRSARIVKFSEKEPSDGVDKPTLPMTPHVRRSRKRSSNIGKSTIEAHDTIPSKMLEKPPERIRRSQVKKL